MIEKEAKYTQILATKQVKRGKERESTTFAQGKLLVEEFRMLTLEQHCKGQV